MELIFSVYEKTSIRLMNRAVSLHKEHMKKLDQMKAHPNSWLQYVHQFLLLLQVQNAVCFKSHNKLI